jgi:anaerobic ribonucleoside-triphosphate reductase activating protein
MNYLKIDNADYVNGDGVFVSVWTAGCPHRCKGCHNPESHNRHDGAEFTDEVFNEVIEYLGDKYISGLSILGGEPLVDYNYDRVLELVKKVKDIYPTKSIWIWTGYTYDYVKTHIPEILFYVDKLIDGPFVEELKCDSKYFGSSNQVIRHISGN